MRPETFGQCMTGWLPAAWASYLRCRASNCSNHEHAETLLEWAFVVSLRLPSPDPELDAWRWRTILAERYRKKNWWMDL